MNAIGKVLPFGKLTELPPEDLARHLQDRYQEWQCPGCETPLAIRADLPRPADLRCYNCQEGGTFRRIRTDRPFLHLTRDAALEATGCPILHREEPRPFRWPAVAPPFEPLDLDAWKGDPWAIGFLGDSGGGKTLMATAIFARLLPRVRTAVWIRADRLVGCLFGREGDEGRAKGVAAMEADILFLDDLGWGTLGASIEPLFGLLAERHADRRRTLWTSNHPLSKLAESAAGQALTRRLQDGAMVPVLGDWRVRLVARGGG